MFIRLSLIFLILGFHFFSFSQILKKGSEKKNPSQIDDLNELSSFSDIVIIQRRFLSKTGRFEAAPNLLLFLSSEFYIHTGAGGGLSFYFLEKHGFEIMGAYSAVMDRSLTTDLANELGFYGGTDSDQIESFAVFTYKWIPIYGKMAIFNRKIVPFDISLSVGGGIARVFCGSQSRSAEGLGGFEFGLCQETGQTVRLGNSSAQRKVKKKWEPAFIGGIGQSFALTRNQVLRWNIYFLYYGGFLTGNISHVDNFLSLSWGFYFPHKKVRK